MTDGFQVEQIDHVEVFVPDVSGAADWYERALGLHVVPGLGWEVPLMLSSDGGSTKLALFKGEPQGDDVGWRRVAFRVSGASFLDFLRRLDVVPVRDRDGSVVGARDVVDHDVAWSVYFCDPYGNPLEITTYDYEMVGEALDDQRGS